MSSSLVRLGQGVLRVSGECLGLRLPCPGDRIGLPVLEVTVSPALMTMSRARAAAASCPGAPSSARSARFTRRRPGGNGPVGWAAIACGIANGAVAIGSSPSRAPGRRRARSASAYPAEETERLRIAGIDVDEVGAMHGPLATSGGRAPARRSGRRRRSRRSSSPGRRPSGCRSRTCPSAGPRGSGGRGSATSSSTDSPAFASIVSPTRSWRARRRRYGRPSYAESRASVFSNRSPPSGSGLSSADSRSQTPGSRSTSALDGVLQEVRVEAGAEHRGVAKDHPVRRREPIDLAGDQRLDGVRQ